MKERLQKIISSAGIASRRKAEELIAKGKVTVNGEVAFVGQSADANKDDIIVDGVKVKIQDKKVYIMLNKPRGYVTTMSDDKGRKNVSMLVDVGARVYPVGRLDMNSEGLLLMTNDGELANKLMHPKHEVTKTYRVKVQGDLRNIDALTEPMDIDGYEIKNAIVKMISVTAQDTANISMTIHEGRNRQIRKMCEKCGLKVIRLTRTTIGQIGLDKDLKAGKYRHLKGEELQYLQSL